MLFRSLTCLRRDLTGPNRDVWIAYNGSIAAFSTNLTSPSPGFRWIRRFDTSLAASDAAEPTPLVAQSYSVAPASVSVCELVELAKA